MKRFSSVSLRFILLLGGIILLVFFLKALNIFTPIQSVFLTVTKPVYSVVYSMGNSFSGLISRPTNIIDLEQENERLRSDNTSLKTSLTLLEGYEQENIALRQLLDFFESDLNDFPRVIARVIGKDPENASILLLNVGERDGIEKNNAVIVEDGVIVAKIFEVYARTSKALLVTDSQSSIAVTVSGGAPTSKMATGSRGLSLILDQIPQQETIQQGQLVITSGLEPTIPRGLLVGEVEEIFSESNDLFQQSVLKPIVDYSAVFFVAIILTPSE